MMEESLFEKAAGKARERIVNAPVEDRIKQEALKELGELVEAHTGVLDAIARDAELKSDMTSATPPDKAWQRQQIVDSLLRADGAGALTNIEATIAQAKVIETYLYGK